MFRKIQTFAASLLCALLVLTASILTTAHAATVHLSSQAKSWVLMDALSGSIMEQKQARRVVNPGELVHLMTLYTALERLEDLCSPLSFTKGRPCLECMAR